VEFGIETVSIMLVGYVYVVCTNHAPHYTWPRGRNNKTWTIYAIRQQSDFTVYLLRRARHLLTACVRAWAKYWQEANSDRASERMHR
jgi:hypothetical protein